MTPAGHAPLFPGVRFARVLSLGDRGAPGRGTADPDGMRTVFDRLVAPLAALPAILADDGARLGLRFVASEAGTAVRCGAYGVLCPDAFPRDDQGRVAFAAENVARAGADLGGAMSAFLRACETAPGPVLFLRSELGPVPPEDRARRDGPDAVVVALARRFPALDFRLLIAASAANAPDDPDRPRDHRVGLALLPDGVDAWATLSPRLAFVDHDPGDLRPAPEAPTADRKAASHDAGQTASDASGGAPIPDPAPPERDDEARLSDLAACLSDGSATPDLAWTIGSQFWRGGRSALAVEAFALAHRHGCREPGFLRDHLGLLTGETRYAEVIDLAASLRREGLAGHPRAARHLAMLTGHARLALAHPREPEIARAEARAASSAWLDAPALLREIAAAVAERRPFALVRLGDGEARYLLGETPAGTTSLTDEEAHAMGDLVWENWFGGPLSAVDPSRRAGLRAAYEETVRVADVVGACGPDRLRRDTGHYGYLAWQERWLHATLAGRTDVRFTDAQVHRRLNADTPFLATLLRGQDVLGVISPHPGLAAALGARLGIARVVDHVIPAEGRLPTAARAREALGPHFPDVYDRLQATLSVPRPGCVFLVAAGLLGKTYCARIKTLGGIALDIGALADAWMGYDTRDGQYADTARLDPAEPDAGAVAETACGRASTGGTPIGELVASDRPASHTAPAAHDTVAVAQEPSGLGSTAEGTTVGCLSLGKTGSMALADAVRNAGFPNAVHLHYLGPRAIAIKHGRPEPMLDLAIDVAGRIADPNHRFRFVTAVRDPIARILSQAFYTAERHHAANGGDISRDPEALIAWWEAKHMAHRDLWSEWFDDTFRTTFGFDFREHPLDRTRGSVRFESPRVRLLVLRQEDDRARRKAELGWLLDRADVALRTVNDATNQRYETAYRPFLEAFVAPAAWLDAYYETEVIRHFYTDEERAAFRARWGGGRARATPRAAAPSGGQPAPADPVVPGGRTEPMRSPLTDPARTILCLSMMKTGSTAIAASLREADPGGEVVHLHHLGPLGRGRLPALGRPVNEVAARLDDSRHRFAVVTCVRDPIARWISEIFHDAAAGADPAAAKLTEDHDAFVARIESKKMMDYSTLWFEDSLRATFGFDVLAHPFDHERGSLRVSSDRVRLLVLRQEDRAATKEAELGWLLGRDRVPLLRRNERSAGVLAEQYRTFLETFVAPDRWFDVFYETAVARHFYTDTERAMFRARWRRAVTPVAAPSIVAPAEVTGPTPLDAGPNGPPESVEPSADTANRSPLPPPEDGDAAAQYAAEPHGADGAALELDRVRTELETLRARLREGHAVDFNDYAYRPRERDWTASAGAARVRALFAANGAAFAGLLERFCAFDDRFRAIPVLPEADSPHWENWWLPGLDAVALYGLVATQAPRTYLEIGSGHSTRFVRRAIRDLGLATRIVSLDPQPTEDVEALCDEVVRVRCEDAPASVFAALGAGDMLFFDGGHRSFQNSDATVFFTEILPGLAPGVVYGLHDIFLPYDYPESWTNRFYNEQYLLLAYLLGGAGGDEVVFPAHHVWREPAYAPLRNRLFLGSRHIDWLTSSFWMRRAGVPPGGA